MITTAEGTYNAQWSAGNSGTFNNSTVALYEGSAVPLISVSPMSLAFGNQTNGTTSTAQVLTVKNTGAATLTISAVAMVAGTNFGETNTCSSVAPNATCTISVKFSPVTTGALSDSVSITDNAIGSPQLFSVSGTGVASTAPAVNLNPLSLSFGNQLVNANSTAQVITLTNTGNATLTVSAVAMITGTQFSQTNNCTSVSASGTCTINVKFDPLTVGAKADTVSITDNAAGSPHTAAVSGTGIASNPVASLSSTSLGFGNQTDGTSSIAQVVTLTNTGNVALTITTVALTTGTQFSETDTCNSSTVQPNGTCTMSITFSPLTAGAKVDTLSITDNASNSPQTIALSGTGIATGANVNLSPTSLNFGLQFISPASSTQVITLTNTGNATLTVSAVAMLVGTQFSQTNNCTSVLANGTCTINVTFKPLLPGPYQDTVSITDSAAGSPHNAPVAGTGVPNTTTGLPTPNGAIP